MKTKFIIFIFCIYMPIVAQAQINQSELRVKLHYDSVAFEKVDFICSLLEITGNNQELVKDLIKKYKIWSIDDVSILLDEDFLRNVVKQNPIPENIKGKSSEERINDYTEYVARKVRLSYPTQVVERMIIDDEFYIGNREIKKAVMAFYSAFPYYKFDKNESQLRDMIENELGEDSSNEQDEVLHEVVRIQRIHAISPTSESMALIYNSNFQSAYDVCQIPKRKFAKRFKGTLHRKTCKQIYRNCECAKTSK